MCEGVVHTYWYRTLLTGYPDDGWQNVLNMVLKTKRRAGNATALSTVPRRLADALEQHVLDGGA